MNISSEYKFLHSLATFTKLLYYNINVRQTEERVSMVSETYVECLVKKKATSMAVFLKALFIMLTVCFCLIGVVFVPATLLSLALGPDLPRADQLYP